MYNAVVFVILLSFWGDANCRVPCVNLTLDKNTDLLKEDGALYYCKDSEPPKNVNFCYVTFEHKDEKSVVVTIVGFNTEDKFIGRGEFELDKLDDGRYYYPAANTYGEVIATTEDGKCFLFWKCPEGADAMLLFLCHRPESCHHKDNNKFIDGVVQRIEEKGVKTLKMKDFDQEECKKLNLEP